IGTDGAEFEESSKAVQDRISKMLNVKGKKTAMEFHRQLGHIMWEKVGMGRTAELLKEAVEEIPKLREEFWQDVHIPGEANNLNQNLEYAGRVADFLEFAELMALDALHREESCGCHFREEYQTPEGEAARDDEHFSYVAAWETGANGEAILHKEHLEYDIAKPSQRNYK
ncbi:MAG: fumarate reductase/succinate dehydrogenase flavoprotein subunit, partial [Abditibacteriaceae bacterium]